MWYFVFPSKNIICCVYRQKNSVVPVHTIRTCCMQEDLHTWINLLQSILILKLNLLYNLSGTGWMHSILHDLSGHKSSFLKTGVWHTGLKCDEHVILYLKNPWPLAENVHSYTYSETWCPDGKLFKGTSVKVFSFFNDGNRTYMYIVCGHRLKPNMYSALKITCQVTSAWWWSGPWFQV